ncbi:homeobox-DDT domain protein RLT3-like isoform X2 [Ipomoea triloba]|uniref:homeobox-DDT domain protein RLT3-like isoform X2 n=1 Tax=Ipomoea triloba TaxID=35885 RepID=UPI00125D3CFB|nr:homeobox-DDT domain protein RLT3-like isoform X2 [Ipomoea triloba]
MAAKKKKQDRNCRKDSGRRSAEQSGAGKGVNCRRNGNTMKRKSTQQQFVNGEDYRFRLQEVLYSPEHIFSKIFRKDGPPLGGEFDSVPEQAFLHCDKDSSNPHRACRENQRAHKRRKMLTPAFSEDQACGEDNPSSSANKHGVGKGLITNKGNSANKYGVGKGMMTVRSALVKRHGIGKGLMTVWRATNPDSAHSPAGVNFGERAKEKKKFQQRQSILKKLANKLQDKRKPALKRRKLETQKTLRWNQPRKEKCELALEEGSEEDSSQFALLVDDEELELQELQTGPNPLTCCTHFTGNGLRGCSLCKDLLAKFPPDTVTMKLPLYMHPWDSSPELAKKIFKVFHFLSTCAVIMDISSFTLDEFACAFHDKDSLLLGQVHVALLRLLLSDVEMQLASGLPCHSSKNIHFLDLVHSVEHKTYILKVWLDSLNALTWIEILRQVLAAAGFGSQCGVNPKEALNKEATFMAKYGLAPGTLKGELFSILLAQGSKGMKVPEVAKLQSIVELNLVETTNELEDLIRSTLSSDITLFEKISSSGYRLRLNPAALGTEIYQLEEDDDSDVSSGYCSNDDSDIECLDSAPAKSRRKNQHVNKTLTVCTEIDESNPGEPWLVGLMEGEYSTLSIEEKLNVLSALVDLLTAASRFKIEDPVTSDAGFAHITINHGSGAKIKRSTAKQRQIGGYCSWLSAKDMSMTSALHPVDSLVLMSTKYKKDNSFSMSNAPKMDNGDDLHPMQSIFLGSDRRYNRYWMFLGPCDDFDPGHRRIYFESSEDGHWEVIDTEEALGTLLSVLDHRGAREARLIASLEKRESVLSQAMLTTINDERVGQLVPSHQCEMSISREESSSSAVSDVDNASLAEVQNGLPSSINSVVHVGKKVEPQRDKCGLAQAFDTWIWKSFYSNLNAVKHGKRPYLDSLARCEWCHDLYWRDEKHCRICHTTFELDFDIEERYAIHSATCGLNIDTNKSPRHKILSSQLQSLKAAIYAIESVMPEDALVGSWVKSIHNLWAKRLRRASTLAEVLQVLADFVSAINEDWVYQIIHDGSNCVLEEFLTSFPTMPQTVSAVALWLVKLDTLVAPYMASAASRNKMQLNAKSKGKHALNV